MVAREGCNSAASSRSISISASALIAVLPCSIGLATDVSNL
jgi:hypothetical protein